MGSFWEGFEKRAKEKDPKSRKQLVADAVRGGLAAGFTGTIGWHAGKALVRGAGKDPKQAVLTPLATALMGIDASRRLRKE